MFVRSTGLGRTLLTAKIAKIIVTNIVPSTLEPPPNGVDEPKRLLMELEITHPVHWTVRAFVEPPDLRQMVKHILKNPGLIWQGFKFLFMKGFKQAEREGEVATVVPRPAAVNSPSNTPPGLKVGHAAEGVKGPGPIPVRKR